MLGGREGVGKTICAYTLAASLTCGRLRGAFTGEPRAVIVSATEDSWEHTRVSVTAGDSETAALTFGSPVDLFPYEYIFAPARARRYDMTQDGERFLMIAEGDVSDNDEAAPSQIIVVQNWFTELERLVPTE